MKFKKAVFPGSFDPMTLGHVDVVLRAKYLFDEVIIAIGINSVKKSLFSAEQRKKWIEQIFEQEPKIKVEIYSGLTALFCKEIEAHYLIRGLRNTQDFEYEKTIAQMNQQIDEQLTTILLMFRPEFSQLSSTVVRELVMAKHDVRKFVPEVIAKEIPNINIILNP